MVMWAVFGIEHLLDADFGSYGVLPLTVEGIKGIFLYPFIHGDILHLFDNSIPLLVLGTMLFYFYRPLAWEISALIWFLSGFWLWIIGRPSYHIGASGFIYGLAAFLFFSGVFRRNINLLAISLLVVFLYGGLIWGLFPIDEHISWEGHLAGAVAGSILAWFYKQSGPQKPRPIVLEEPDDSNPYWLVNDPDSEGPKPEEPPAANPVIFRYYIRPGEGDDPSALK
jgi:membrane associated rhomboid family serine protease